MTLGIDSVYKSLQVSDITKKCDDKKAVFFDMDGTILNSESLHFEAISRLTNYNSPYTINDLYGMADVDVYPLIQQFTHLDLENFLESKSLMMKKIVPTSNVSDILLVDIPKLIQALKDSGKKLALVTASERDTTHSLLKHCNLLHQFDIVITRQDTHKTKPDPAPYQHALSMLGIKKEDAIIFEDSPTGIASAIASGIKVIKVEWYAHEEKK